MKIYNDMGGRKIKENNESFNWLKKSVGKDMRRKHEDHVRKEIS